MSTFGGCIDHPVHLDPIDNTELTIESPFTFTQSSHHFTFQMVVGYKGK